VAEATQSQLEAVQTAIGVLDKVAPANWRSRVNLDSLDMSSTRYCILEKLGNPVPAKLMGAQVTPDVRGTQAVVKF